MSHETYLDLRVERITQETWNTKSFHLVPADGSAIAPYLPGQHLLFRLPVAGAGHERKLLRFYTLSDCYRPGGAYRISVKLEAPPANAADAPAGEGSSFLHTAVNVGDLLSAKGPVGDFVLDPLAAQPLVLVAGGIGITPILAMMHGIAEARNSGREVHVFLGMRTKSDHAFKTECEALAQRCPSLRLTVCYDEATEADLPGQDYTYAERVSLDLLQRLLPHRIYQYYICGPRPMMDSLTHGLRDWGVADADVFTESFGPATATKLIAAEEPKAEVGPAGIEVTFAKSGKTCTWDPAFNCLLEFAEAQGISLSAGCLYGDCGTCMTTLPSGSVRYNHATGIEPDAGSCLPCSCKPAESIVIDA